MRQLLSAVETVIKCMKIKIYVQFKFEGFIMFYSCSIGYTFWIP